MGPVWLCVAAVAAFAAAREAFSGTFCAQWRVDIVRVERLASQDVDAYGVGWRIGKLALRFLGYIDIFFFWREWWWWLRLSFLSPLQTQMPKVCSTSTTSAGFRKVLFCFEAAAPFGNVNALIWVGAGCSSGRDQRRPCTIIHHHLRRSKQIRTF